MQAGSDPKNSHAFLSYVKADDDYLEGGISWLKTTLEQTVRALGCNEFQIFQDADIEHGENWSKVLHLALKQAHLFIPILTPRFFHSKFCRQECILFMEHERSAKRDDLILPIYLIGADVLDDPKRRAKDELATRLHERQFADWCGLEFALRDKDTRPRIVDLAKTVARRGGTEAKIVSERRIWASVGREYIEPPSDLGKSTGRSAESGRVDSQAPSKESDGSRSRRPSEQPGLKDAFVRDDPVEQLKDQIETLKILIRNQEREIEKKDDDIDRMNGDVDLLKNQVRSQHANIERLAKWRQSLIGLCIVAGILGVGMGWIVRGQFPTFDDQLREMKKTGLEETEEKAPPQYLPRTPDPATSVHSPGTPDGVGSPAEETTPDAAVQPGKTSALVDVAIKAFRDCDRCPEMVALPSGSFEMGSPDGENGRENDEGPQRTVTIRAPFALGKYEVTRAQFEHFVSEEGYQATGCRYWDGNTWVNDGNRSWRNPGFEQADDHPVTCVSWEDAQAYVGWLGRRTGEDYRLPSEAEWEYAARAGSTAPYFWGAENDSPCSYANGLDRTGKRINGFDRFAFSCDDGHAQTAPVGSFPANGFGLHDMAGNVWEWVEDRWHNGYAAAPIDGSPWIAGGTSWRVNRGGSWAFNPWSLRSAKRRALAPDERNFGLGFRVARTSSQG